MKDEIFYYVGGAGAFLILLAIIVICCNCRKKKFERKQRVYVVPVQEPASPRRDVDLVRDSPNRKSTYLVPFSALPGNFDYSDPKVEVKDDHVVISDLSLIQEPDAPNVPREVPPEVQKQAPYNPSYGYMI